MHDFMQIGIRVGAVALGLVVWFWTQKLISQKTMVGNGVGDRLHQWTAPLHAWLLANPSAANATLVITSACIDAFGLFLLGSAIFGPSLRPFVAILILFGLRQVCQAICTLPIPKAMIWRNPGFPSLLVTYGTSNDFFFSGHTGIAVLGAMELAHTAPVWVAAIAAGIALAEAVTVIVLRAHYTMDVFAAIFTAWAAETIAYRIAPALDVWLHHLT